VSKKVVLRDVILREQWEFTDSNGMVYFPMQNSEKILPNKSSLVKSPVI